MQGLRSRLDVIAKRLDAPQADVLAAQLALLIKGAFVSSELPGSDDATEIPLAAVHALGKAARPVSLHT